MTKEQIAVVEKTRNTLLRDSTKAVSLNQRIEMNEVASALTALLQHVRENECPTREMRPVLKDGTLENFILRVGGKGFRCRCGCNVFHKPDDTRMEHYQCNGCGLAYDASDPTEDNNNG